MNRAGLPAHSWLSGTLPVTTDPAPIIEFLPMTVPFRIMLEAPMNAFSLIVTGAVRFPRFRIRAVEVGVHYVASAAYFHIVFYRDPVSSYNETAADTHIVTDCKFGIFPDPYGAFLYAQSIAIEPVVDSEPFANGCFGPFADCQMRQAYAAQG